MLMDDWAGAAAERTVVRRSGSADATFEWDVRWPVAAADESVAPAVLDIKSLDLPATLYLPAVLQP